MIRRAPDVIQIIVFAADPHDLLRIAHARRFGKAQAQEDFFELIHPGIGEQQSGIIHRSQRGAGHDDVIFGRKEIEELLAHLAAGRNLSIAHVIILK